jgi:hypothetical protein
MAFTSTDVTLADLLERFGPMPAARIRYDPPPGTATEQDVIALEARKNRLFELVSWFDMMACLPAKCYEAKPNHTRQETILWQWWITG